MTARPRLGPWLPLLAGVVGSSLGGCSGEPGPPLQRSGRLGSLRDLVLFERPADKGGAFFLDRFEVTRADWTEFAATEAGRAVAAPMPSLVFANDGALPMAGIDLLQARAFAHWRGCRLPRSDELSCAITNNNPHNSFPWGTFPDSPDAARANTHQLGLGEPTPVGTFESGRAGDGPYDLVGNVAEWTETVSPSWFRGEREPIPAVTASQRALLRAPALAVWNLPALRCSPQWLVQAAGVRAPREVLGGDFASSLDDVGTRSWAPTDRSDTVGLRLCTTPGELLLALLALRGSLDERELLQVRRFGARDAHAAVLRAAVTALALPAEQDSWLRSMLP